MDFVKHVPLPTVFWSDGSGVLSTTTQYWLVVVMQDDVCSADASARLLGDRGRVGVLLHGPLAALQ